MTVFAKFAKENIASTVDNLLSYNGITDVIYDSNKEPRLKYLKNIFTRNSYIVIIS